MKHLKRSLALLLSMALILAVMAGCGGSASSAPAAEASKSEPAPAATEEAAPEQPQAPAADETGSAAETSAAEEEAIPDLQLPLTEGETLSYWQTKPGGAVANMAPNGYFDYPHFQEAARLTGVTLDFIQADFMVANEQFNLMIASQDYPDIFGSFNSLYSDGDDNGIEEEVILALEDYEDLFPHYQKYRTSTKFLETATSTAEGHISGFYELMSDFIGPFFGMMGRGDWIEALGMDVPETYDELHELLMAMKNQYGCTTAIYLDSAAVGNDNFLAAGYGAPCMLATNAKESYWKVQDGKVITAQGPGAAFDFGFYLVKTLAGAAREQEVRHGTYYRFANAPGAMDPDGMAEITSGNCGVFFNGAPMMSMYSTMSDDPNLRLIGLPDPVKEKGDKTHVDTTEYDFGVERMSISTKCKDPELAIQYCDFWFTDQGIQLANYGVEGLSCEVVDGKPQFTDTVLNNPDLAAGDAISFYTGRNNTPSWSSNSKLLVSFNEDEANAFEVWSASRDNRDSYPYVAQLTIDENYEISKLAADYESYALECRDKFITGDMDIEKEYDSYVEKVRTMGLTRALEIKQEAYDRYMAQ
mgnify:CR=1 FL=1